MNNWVNEKVAMTFFNKDVVDILMIEKGERVWK